jgi:hypothetical protein
MLPSWRNQILLSNLDGNDPVQCCVSLLLNLAYTASAEWFKSRMRSWLESLATPTVLPSLLRAPAQERRNEK